MARAPARTARFRSGWLPAGDGMRSLTTMLVPRGLFVRAKVARGKKVSARGNVSILVVRTTRGPTVVTSELDPAPSARIELPDALLSEKGNTSHEREGAGRPPHAGFWRTQPYSVSWTSTLAPGQQLQERGRLPSVGRVASPLVLQKHRKQAG